MCDFLLDNGSINRNIKSSSSITPVIVTSINVLTTQSEQSTTLATLDPATQFLSITKISHNAIQLPPQSLRPPLPLPPPSLPSQLPHKSARELSREDLVTTAATQPPPASSHHCNANKSPVSKGPRRYFSTNNKNNNKNINNKTVKSTSTLSLNKWQIIVTSIIILLLCCTSHVLAIRKGRLMTPSTFTALSGDLHVQIQFSQDPEDNDEGTLQLHRELETSTTSRTTDGKQSKSNSKETINNNHINNNNNNKKASSLSGSHNDAEMKEEDRNDRSITTSSVEIESIITSTLVISKYIEMSDEVLQLNNSLSGWNNTFSHPKALSNDTLVLQRQRKEIIQNIPLFPDPRHNVTQVAVPCQTFMFGGLYEMQVISNLKTTNTQTLNGTLMGGKTEATPTMSTTTTTLIPVSDERLRQTLDVRWPSAEMIVSPVRLKTYPDAPVEVTLRFPEVNCENAWKREDLPEFWLELIYCGKQRTCSQLMPQNISKSSILFAEQVRGFPKHVAFKLSCSLFGLAGNYAVQLRPMVPLPHLPITRRFLSVDWSEKYVFNVYARSIFPCDPHTGIGVLYEYPGCILEQGDRVRVYAKLRADVASLKPPTTLHYIAEQRVVKNQYSLYFSCELFTEKYVEYCFVYVTQAISGAVADVRMDCVPTLPVRESDTGGWGPWSEWTPCSTNCLGGTRNRYRFCDSPPPRYGAKFCEGSSVQTEKCGNSMADTWDCIYETSGSAVNKFNRTDVSQEIGPGCRCGCIVHLGTSKPKRIIAGATQSCPGRSFWLIQVDGEEHISMQLSFLRLPCATQYIKIRDGPSLSSTLLIEMQGGGAGGSASGAGGGGGGGAGGIDDTSSNNMINFPVMLESTGEQLLLEFYAGEDGNGGSSSSSNNASTMHTGLICTGGFLANVEEMRQNASLASQTIVAASGLSLKSRAFMQKPKLKTKKFTLVHLSAIVFASIIILISALLGAQYVVRYRKYHLAVSRRLEEGSRLHTPRASMSSLHNPPSRAVSTTTLISEVIYMVKMRPKHQLRHSILRESIDAENLAKETEMNDTTVKEPMVKCVEEFGSNNSIMTLRNEITSGNTDSISQTPSTEEGIPAITVNDSTGDDDDDDDDGDADVKAAKYATIIRKDSAKDSESIISSGMSSICNSPPMNTKRLSKYSERYDAATLKMTNSFKEEKTDCESIKSMVIQRYGRKHPRSNSVNLTNGCYSPASSIISSATIRSTNNKESKDKQNRKKLLARPGSEFSLGNPEDFELDYYDYNVTNAGAAPGSYLGMDPAYLIWIPPFDDIPDSPDRDDDKTPEPLIQAGEHHHQPLYEDIKMPKYGHYLSPHSNTNSSNTTTNTSPTSEEISPLSSSNLPIKTAATTPSETDLKNCLIQKAISSSTSSSSKNQQQQQQPISSKSTPYLRRKLRKERKRQSKSTHSLGMETEVIPLQDLNLTKSARNLLHHAENRREPETILETDSMNGSYIEKETSVVKSPSDLENYLTLDDIQYADDSENEQDISLSELAKLSERKLSAKEILTEECKLLRDMKKVTTVVAKNRAQMVRRTEV